MAEYDFSGWATRNDLLCADGRTIRKNAFVANDGKEVPLVWNHQHNDPDNVLGHALLENRDEGVYAYCTFNDSESGKMGRELVRHGDVKSLSIYANKLKQSKTGDVFHGMIRELSLVIAGANPGAYIDTVLAHSEDGDVMEGIEACYDENIVLYHSEEKPDKDEKENKEMADSNEKTVGDVINSMTEEQRQVMYTLIGQALEDAGKKDENEGEDEDMKHNIFESDNVQNDTLSHADLQSIIASAPRVGSMRESFLQHADEDDEIPYGIENIDQLFPDAKNMNVPPTFIQREMDWVKKVMGRTHHTPFSRIKTMFADITEDQARAKGYIKGNLKKEQVFSLLKRSTQPTTVYKKQKFDRDDITDITDFDVVAWVKSEMRTMLDEEIARAILLGDGRQVEDADHINEEAIRPILKDADLFVIRWAVAGEAEERAKNFIKACIKARKNYKGSGNPDLFTTEDMLTDMLLLEDGVGHKLYRTEAELATALRVKEIITVPVMEGYEHNNHEVFGIIVNLADYTVGADKGGAVNMFDDFDIDYNQFKYLIETRCSGSLVKPFSAIVLSAGTETKSLEPTMKEAMDPFRAKTNA